MWGTVMICSSVVHYCEVSHFLQMGKVVWVGFYKRLKKTKQNHHARRVLIFLSYYNNNVKLSVYKVRDTTLYPNLHASQYS